MPVVELGKENWTFDLPAVLIQVVNGPGRTLGIVLESVGIQPGAAHEFPGGSVKLVTAALEDYVHDAAGSVTVLRVIGVALHLEFLHSIHNGHIGDVIAASLPVVGRAIDEEFVLTLAAAVD